MKIIFLSGMYPKSLTQEIIANSKSGIQFAANTFQTALINGFKKYPNISMEIINIPFLGYFPRHYKKIKVSGIGFSDICERIRNHSYGFINIPIYKDLSRFLIAKRELKKWTLINQGDKTVLIYSANLPFLLAAQFAKKFDKSLKICTIVTDLPGSPAPSNLVKRILRSIEAKFVYRKLLICDSFIFLTEEMNQVINKKGKPYEIIEGIYDQDEEPQKQIAKCNFKVVLYSGTIDRKFGIVNLLKAFSSIEGANYRLWICGGGSDRDLKEVQKYCRKDKRIEYFGSLNREEVLNLQRKATVLINPRDGSGEYTKFSFPSKTMEYLASGTPVILKKLHGIPDEYYRYCHCIEGDSVLDMTKKIMEVCELPENVNESFGLNARSFIINEKNSCQQAGKIIGLIDKS